MPFYELPALCAVMFTGNEENGLCHKLENVHIEFLNESNKKLERRFLLQMPFLAQHMETTINFSKPLQK